jgi:hypothetical protein
MPISPDQYLPSVHLSMQQFVTQASAILDQLDNEEHDYTMDFIRFVLCGRRFNGPNEERIFVDQYLPINPNNVSVIRNSKNLIGVTNTIPFYKNWALTPFRSDKIDHSFSLQYSIQGTVCTFIFMLSLFTHSFSKHRPPPKPVTLCHIPQIPFGRSVDDSITTLIAFPELYRRDGSTSITFPERKLLWERCIRPALMETHPEAVAGLPRTLNCLKTIGGNTRNLLQNTSIPLDHHRPQFLDRFTQLMAAHSLFTSWFFIHIVNHDQIPINPMDAEAREMAWTSLTENLHVEEDLNKWFTQIYCTVNIPNHVLRLKPEGPQTLLQALLPDIAEDRIQSLLSEHTSTMLYHNCFGQNCLNINCIQDNNIFAPQRIFLSPAASSADLGYITPKDLLPKNIDRTYAKIEALKTNLGNNLFTSCLFESTTADMVMPIQSAKMVFSNMDIIHEVFDIIPCVTMM